MTPKLSKKRVGKQLRCGYKTQTQGLTKKGHCGQYLLGETRNPGTHGEERGKACERPE